MAVFKPLFTLYGHSVAGAGQLVKIQLRIGAGNQLGNIHPQPLRAFVKVRKVEILSAAFERFVFGGRDPAYGSHFGNRNFQVFPRPFQPLCDKLCLFHMCVPPAGKNKKGFIRNEMKPEKTSFIPLICRRVHADPTLLRRELRPCLKNSAGQPVNADLLSLSKPLLPLIYHRFRCLSTVFFTAFRLYSAAPMVYNAQKRGENDAE